MAFYEYWPYQIRNDIWASAIFALSGSFHFSCGHDYYYEIIQSHELTIINLCAYYIFLIPLIITILVVTLNWKIHFKIIKIAKRKFIFYKWLAWFLEILFFPILLNIVHFSTF